MPSNTRKPQDSPYYVRPFQLEKREITNGEHAELMLIVDFLIFADTILGAFTFSQQQFEKCALSGIS